MHSSTIDQEQRARAKAKERQTRKENAEAESRRIESLLRKPVADLPANLTRREAFAYLRISPRAGDRLIAAGKLRFNKVGRGVLIPRSEVRRLLES